MLNIKVNIAYIVIKLARYTSNLNNIYFIAIKKIYKYLKDIKDYNITYYKNKNYFISKYCNVDYISDINITKSINNYLILYTGSIIS